MDGSSARDGDQVVQVYLSLSSANVWLMFAWLGVLAEARASAWISVNSFAGLVKWSSLSLHFGGSGGSSKSIGTQGGKKARPAVCAKQVLPSALQAY